jgi:hypothetical protein
MIVGLTEVVVANTSNTWVVAGPENQDDGAEKNSDVDDSDSQWTEPAARSWAWGG